MLKSLLFYRLSAGLEMTPGGLEYILRQFPLRPPTGLALESSGFVPVNESGQYVVSVEKRFLFEYGMERKILPGRVVKRLVDEKAKAFEQLKGFKPGRKVLRTLKEEAITELLPKAFVQGSSIRGWFDLASGWLFVGTASPSKAEEVVAGLRNALGSLAVRPAQPLDLGVSAQLTAWVHRGQAEGRFQLEDAVDLRGADEKQSTVKYNRHELDVESVKQLLGEGKQVTRLALSWNDRISLALTEKLQVQKVAMLNLSERQPPEGDNADDLFAGEFALFSGEVAQLIGDMASALNLAPLVEEAA